VTITPSGAPGTVVTGTPFIDTWDTAVNSGMQLVEVPYTYTIK
jgi:hypothetical protein